jgi:hypothetical protein
MNANCEKLFILNIYVSSNVYSKNNFLNVDFLCRLDSFKKYNVLKTVCLFKFIKKLSFFTNYF